MGALAGPAWEAKVPSHGAIELDAQHELTGGGRLEGDLRQRLVLPEVRVVWEKAGLKQAEGDQFVIRARQPAAFANVAVCPEVPEAIAHDRPAQRRGRSSDRAVGRRAAGHVGRVEAPGLKVDRDGTVRLVATRSGHDGELSPGSHSGGHIVPGGCNRRLFDGVWRQIGAERGVLGIAHVDPIDEKDVARYPCAVRLDGVRGAVPEQDAGRECRRVPPVVAGCERQRAKEVALQMERAHGLLGFEQRRLVPDLDGLGKVANLHREVQLNAEARLDGQVALLERSEAGELGFHQVHAGREIQKAVEPVLIAGGRPPAHQRGTRRRHGDAGQSRIRVIAYESFDAAGLDLGGGGNAQEQPGGREQRDSAAHGLEL